MNRNFTASETTVWFFSEVEFFKIQRLAFCFSHMNRSRILKMHFLKCPKENHIRICTEHILVAYPWNM